MRNINAVKLKDIVVVMNIFILYDLTYLTFGVAVLSRQS